MSILQVSTAQITTISDGTNSTSSTNAILGSAKAWVNFNGTTSPGTIRASYNVSSVSKNGTGDYSVNLTNALADANYSFITSLGAVSNGGAVNPSISTRGQAVTSASCRFISQSAVGGVADIDGLYVAVFR